MARIHRPKCPGATVFFTLCLLPEAPIRLTDHITRLRASLRAEMAARPFRIDACVVLPDHLHAILTLPPGDAGYALRWSSIKAQVSRGLASAATRPSQLARREKGLWQRGFWEHHIRDRADLFSHMRHCWTDPVRHGLCARPQDWAYSSYHRDHDAAQFKDVLSASPPRFPTGEPEQRRAS